MFTTQKLIWLRGLLSPINHLSCTATSLLIDNQGAISLIKNGLSSEYSKHIELCYYFICEKFANGTIAAKYILSRSLTVDFILFSLFILFYFSFLFPFSFSIFRATWVRGYQSRCHISHKLMA